LLDIKANAINASNTKNIGGNAIQATISSINQRKNILLIVRNKIVIKF